MKVRKFCKKYLSREQQIVLIDEKTNFIDETVDNLLLKNSYYGDFNIKSIHSTTCRTFNPDKEEDVLALVITKGESSSISSYEMREEINEKLIMKIEEEFKKFCIDFNYSITPHMCIYYMCLNNWVKEKKVSKDLKV